MKTIEINDNNQIINFKNTGCISDGYHTFDELYNQRAVLFITLCNTLRNLSWKSLKHFDENDPMYEGMFICGISLPTGQVTYHLDINPYWELLKVETLDRGLKWDGSTPSQCIERLINLYE